MNELELSTQYRLKYASYYEKQLSQLILLIELYYKEHRWPEFYAAQLSVSTRQLSRITLKHFKKTPYQMVQERIFLEAKRLLVYTNISIKEITYELGICDPAHFSRCFKQWEGMSPVAYRVAKQKN